MKGIKNDFLRNVYNFCRGYFIFADTYNIKFLIKFDSSQFTKDIELRTTTNKVNL